MKKEKKNILVPVDFSKESYAGLATAADIAVKAGARLHLLHIIDDYQPSDLKVAGDMIANKDKHEEHDRFISELLRKRNNDFRNLRGQFSLDQLEVEQRIEFGQFEEQLEKQIAANEIDFVVMGTSGETSFQELVSGNHAVRTMRLSKVPVLVAKEYDPALMQGDRLMLLHDLEEYETSTVRLIKDFAEFMHMHVFITHLRKESDNPNKEVFHELELFAKKNSFIDYSLHIIGEGQESEEVTEFAKNSEIDIVASISKELAGLVRILIGDETEEFLHQFEQPMLVISE